MATIMGNSAASRQTGGATANNGTKAHEGFPPLKEVVPIMAALYLCMFLIALDRTIIGTAIPKITDEFHSIKDVGWYGSAYLLTSCAFQLIYGRLYSFYNPKWVMLFAVVIFETGSAISAGAPNSVAFILGRAISGFGTAGVFNGCISIMVAIIPLHKRPTYNAIFGAVFGVAAVAGPLLGGLFTTRVTWRWCFLINLPIGAIVVLILMALLHTPPSKNTDTIRQQIMKLDPYGSVVFLPGVVCLLLALQWGGTTYSWGDVRIAFLFILAGILLGTFCYIQYSSGDSATVPIRIISQRSIASGAYLCFVLPGAMIISIFFLPIWFQAIKGVSAIRSGIDTLPFVFAFVFASIIAGRMTSVTGYYVPQLLACSVIMSIGAGLFTTLNVDTNAYHWIGSQFIFGFGLGLGMQQSGLAAQASLPKKDVMIGASLMFFFQALGGAIWLSIGQTIFTQSLVSRLSHIADLDPAMIINAGATELRNLVPAHLLPAVLEAYNAAISDAFKLGAGCAAATIIAGLTMEWRDIHHREQDGRAAKRNLVGIELRQYTNLRRH